MGLTRRRRLTGASSIAATRRIAKSSKKDCHASDLVIGESTLKQLRQRLRRRVDRGQWPGLAAAVYVDGKLQLLEEAGYADIEAKAPMTRRSLVRIYSMTKCVVAAAVLQLAEAGRLRLDDPISKHIPAFKAPRVVAEGADGMPDFARTAPVNKPILIRHLLTHTSGISCGISPGLDGPKVRSARERAWAGIYKPLVDRVDSGDIKNLAQWVHELAELPLIDQPGTRYNYSYSYDILGYLVELKSGQKLQQYLRKHILGPLAMRDTSFELNSTASGSSKLSVLYRYTKSAKFGSNGKANRLVRVDPPRRGAASLWSGRCQVPSGGGCVSGFEGGLLSTLDDYSSFLLTLLNGGAHPVSKARILSAKSAEQMLADQIKLLRPPGSSRGPPASASPYDDRGLGLCCIGELQRKGAPCWGRWFDGVEGVRQWGGAASTAFKYDPNGGHPILAVLMTQALPQDDGDTITTLMQEVRKALSMKRKTR
eukprot:TRINITY_DN4628_c3_g1_i1.p1 TRINITY_DN4628_c3_g1~~TRINITY_DN4628_c3_g1_i1.p1  ORF type:complete len:482 (-),score=76.78 TRINITY_DN4628_c3_g1_i1:249-1694(-)